MKGDGGRLVGKDRGKRYPQPILFDFEAYSLHDNWEGNRRPPNRGESTELVVPASFAGVL